MLLLQKMATEGLIPVKNLTPYFDYELEFRYE